jgi:hypothetical protein
MRSVNPFDIASLESKAVTRLFKETGVKNGVRSILLALSFAVEKVRKYVVHYLPVAEGILCLISGFS